MRSSCSPRNDEEEALLNQVMELCLAQRAQEEHAGGRDDAPRAAEQREMLYHEYVFHAVDEHGQEGCRRSRRQLRAQARRQDPGTG